MNDPSQNRESEAQTLHEVLERLERDGFVGHFGARGGGRVRCFACGCDFAPSEAEVESIRRLEGASDPADMLAVLPLRCPRCVTAGTLVLGYGPEAALEDSEVLAALPPAAHPPLP